MREIRSYGSVRGVRSNPHPYRDKRKAAAKQRPHRLPSAHLGDTRGPHVSARKPTLADEPPGSPRGGDGAVPDALAAGGTPRCRDHSPNATSRRGTAAPTKVNRLKTCSRSPDGRRLNCRKPCSISCGVQRLRAPNRSARAWGTSTAASF
jgi:hypothetical protein